MSCESLVRSDEELPCLWALQRLEIAQNRLFVMSCDRTAGDDGDDSHIVIVYCSQLALISFLELVPIVLGWDSASAVYLLLFSEFTGRRIKTSPRVSPGLQWVWSSFRMTFSREHNRTGATLQRWQELEVDSMSLDGSAHVLMKAQTRKPRRWSVFWCMSTRRTRHKQQEPIHR